MTSKKQGTLLITDDEPEIREVVQLSIGSLGYRVLEAGDGQEALSITGEQHVDVVLSDLMMPHLTGLGLLSELRAGGFMHPFIILTAFPSQDSTLQALRLGAFDYVEKPFEADELCKLLQEAMRVSFAMQMVGAGKVKVPSEIEQLKTLRFAESGGSQDRPARHVVETFIAEATPQIVFCDASIKALSEPAQRTFELGYLFRVMQAVASAAEAVKARDVAKLARQAQRFYTALRVKPNAVTGEIMEMAEAANSLLRQVVQELGQANTRQAEVAECIGRLGVATDVLEGTRALKKAV